MEVCKNCCKEEIVFKSSHIGVCEICDLITEVISITASRDEIDKEFYSDIGGEA